ncbi:inositol monophosphatase family protein [Steroidobacter flavus]|uniref:Inositol monophosphatase family protein n=1 Tax=Steroidobacter flavus TaxID=1842136 RepID=A0ABV8T0F7_9GAMM
MLSDLVKVTHDVGARILQCRAEGNLAGDWQGTQFKAVADTIADECMRAGLLRIADIPVVSEEDLASQSLERPKRYWLIDPIDGTASFVHGFSGFVCQAALIEDGQAVLAAVHAPALENTYAAQRGKGATLNGRPITTRKADRDDVILVDNYPEPRGLAARVFRDLPCSKYLESGSIGLKICLVAQGAADLFAKDVPLRDWDVAAPQLILSEAGGVLRRFDGEAFVLAGPFEKLGLIAAASPALQARVSEVVALDRAQTKA